MVHCSESQYRMFPFSVIIDVAVLIISLQKCFVLINSVFFFFFFFFFFLTFYVFGSCFRTLAVIIVSDFFNFLRLQYRFGVFSLVIAILFNILCVWILF